MLVRSKDENELRHWDDIYFRVRALAAEMAEQTAVPVQIAMFAAFDALREVAALTYDEQVTFQFVRANILEVIRQLEKDKMI